MRFKWHFCIFGMSNINLTLLKINFFFKGVKTVSLPKTHNLTNSILIWLKFARKFTKIEK